MAVLCLFILMSLRWQRTWDITQMVEILLMLVLPAADVSTATRYIEVSCSMQKVTVCAIVVCPIGLSILTTSTPIGMYGMRFVLGLFQLLLGLAPF